MKPNCYLVEEGNPINSARNNLLNVIYGFSRNASLSPFGYTMRYSYWVHLERFWWWFKQFNRGGWASNEDVLRDVMTTVTLRHYPAMTRQDIEDEVKSVLSAFLFEGKNLSIIEMDQRARFIDYLESLFAALE